MVFIFNLIKGGLISLAAATVGLTNEAAQHLEVRFAYMLFYFWSSNAESFTP